MASKKRGSGNLKTPAKQPPLSPRTSSATMTQHRQSSRASLNSQHSASPLPRRPASPHARSTAASPHAGAARSRTPSMVSVNSSKKSPVAQMRADFDQLKVKNQENESLIVQQKAELDQLRQQLANMSPPSTPGLPPAGMYDQPTPPISQSNTLTDIQHTQALLDKEETLKKREQEILHLQQKLEQAQSVPNIVIDDSTNKLAELEEKEKQLAERELALEVERKNAEKQDEQDRLERERKMAELEQQLAERELALNEERQKVDQEKQDALQLVNDQLDKLKIENEDAVTQLAVREQELDSLRQQIKDTESTQTDEALEKLQQQLDQQKKDHEASIREHETALAEKEALLKEKEAALTQLQESHNSSLLDLKSKQALDTQSLKLQHQQDILELHDQMEQLKAQGNTGDLSKQQQEYLETELEKVLNAFEQTEHDHAAELQDMQQSHQSALSKLEQTHVHELKSFGANQGAISTRYLPVQAVSWPAPQPLSILRKTPGPRITKSTTGSVLPADKSLVQIYVSSVSGNPTVKKNQEELVQLLKSKDIAHELLDVASSDAVLQHMKRCNQQVSPNGRIMDLPQLFVGGEYRGQMADVQEHVEQGQLDKLLVAAVDQPTPESLPEKQTPLPTRSPIVTDEDEALFQELEQELALGNINDLDLEHL
ncbi:hypothetical protein DM01DRAFT_1338957 [Hesseltinella vesiculosa]|uniref:Uncharacterized protein n=1 Tax=Hesseltinella vesiculosa TaxID=101127 RepID=A0A1X2G9L6_9FUNG|nr:hypothetical protein DM01DRAFT_1338957 [Hesseltinella vesiculosa]